MRNKKILITGATKGLGLECVKYYLKKNYQIIATGRDEKYLKNFSKQITFIKGDEWIAGNLSYHLPKIIYNIKKRPKWKYDSTGNYICGKYKNLSEEGCMWLKIN